MEFGLERPLSGADRLGAVAEFYDILRHLAAEIGGPRKLADCSGRLPWPSHGIYFFFENGERRSDSGAGDRVVRVGTHALTATSRTRLWNRLSQHRGVSTSGGGNHRGSVFRLLVGEALLDRDSVPPVQSWGKGQSAGVEVRRAESEHEIHVSRHIRSMPFLWLNVPNDQGGPPMRGMIERNAIALLSNWGQAPIDPASTVWLGRSSPRPKVSSSGLWNQNHVDEVCNLEFLAQMWRLVRGH